ncbi:VOC family protein [Bradyrhizobium centrolobii]|nr:VOC family protein [Bradyrhizobium centrolobii]
MGHVTFGTPDPERSAQDLVDLVGLRVSGRHDRTVFLTSNERLYEIAFRQDTERYVATVGLEAMDAHAVDEVYRRAISDGLEVIDDRPLGPAIEHAVRFKAPFGLIIEVHTPVKRSEAARYIGPGSRPPRIEHVNFKVPDVLAVRDVFTNVLGLKLSDRTTGDEFNWFRAHDGYHHTVAVFRGEPALHHYAFDFHSLQDLARIADSLVLKDRTLLWGPGRHGAGGNVFQYYVDPNNCVVEMSVGMDRIYDDALYQARDWEMMASHRWINLWGSAPPNNFSEPGVAFASTPIDLKPGGIPPSV